MWGAGRGRGRHQAITWTKAGPCITNVIATCRKNFSQWESSFLWKLRCHWLKFLRRVAKTLVIQGPALPSKWSSAAYCLLRDKIFVSTQDFNPQVVFEIYTFEITGTSPIWQLVKASRTNYIITIPHCIPYSRRQVMKLTFSYPPYIIWYFQPRENLVICLHHTMFQQLLRRL